MGRDADSDDDDAASLVEGPRETYMLPSSAWRNGEDTILPKIWRARRYMPPVSAAQAAACLPTTPSDKARRPFVFLTLHLSSTTKAQGQGGFVAQTGGCLLGLGSPCLEAEPALFEEARGHAGDGGGSK